jgi:hypothetical protein
MSMAMSVSEFCRALFGVVQTGFRRIFSRFRPRATAGRLDQALVRYARHAVQSERRILQHRVSGSSCFGYIEREAGQSLVPEPPDRMTGIKLFIEVSGWSGPCPRCYLSMIAPMGRSYAPSVLRLLSLGATSPGIFPRPIA